ncbi:MAG: hypothetical protein DWC07_02315 [Candidatus Poseidoniales archaeon]|nr:MAG: hypothetical protein DWC07_02315 [Candidatus Poseidoniales archaeon]
MTIMPGLLDLILIKEKVNGDRDNIFLMLFEKAFILIALLVIFLIGVGLGLPDWGVAVLVGGSLGPVVYGHYYFIYIRPVKKQQNLDVRTKQGTQ